MFESDDFDQVLSQFDFPDVSTKTEDLNVQTLTEQSKQLSPLKFINKNVLPTTSVLNPELPQKVIERKVEKSQTCIPINLNCENISPKHMKRKIISSHFDHNAKRKFPGPAGILSGNYEDKNETICHMELFSQDIDISDYRGDKFESQIWRKLLEDTSSSNLGAIDSIKSVKQQAQAGNLRRRKAQAVTAFVETVDRSATDPLITLRDTTGHIKCTLHRDAWSTFSPYIVSEFCALVLRKPTVLTTGSAFKKHYLNITLSNIHAIYSSAVLAEDSDSKPLPDGYNKDCSENFTIIKVVQCNSDRDKNPFCNESINDTSDLLDDLDNIFTDDLF